MRLTLVQSALAWESPAANRAMFTEKLAQLAGQTDLIVLPEMFTTGFSINADVLAEPMNGPTVQWMRAMAQQIGAAVTGSIICREQDHFFNRLVWMYPDGEHRTYDKRHLFSLVGEHETFTQGEQPLVVEWLGWRVRPLICYDLRFPVWSRNITPKSFGNAAESTLSSGASPQNECYDLLLYVANWPNRRAHHWRSLLPARAIENQVFAAGVNVVGKDGNGYEYSGNSMLVDYSGIKIFELSGQEGIFTTKLSLEDLQAYRRQLPFLADADSFNLF